MMSGESIIPLSDVQNVLDMLRITIEAMMSQADRGMRSHDDITAAITMIANQAAIMIGTVPMQYRYQVINSFNMYLEQSVYVNGHPLEFTPTIGREQ
jgi:hypothetical protein